MNDPVPPLRPSVPAWLRASIAPLLIACVAWYGVFLFQHTSPHAGGSDSSGYLNSARLLMRGELLTLPRALPGHSASEFGELSVVPLGFTLRPGDQMAPTYPTGYPMQLLVASLFGWSRAAAVANLFTALASGFFLFIYCRKLGISRGLSLAGVALLWFCPLFLFSVFQPMSDLSAVCWALATLYFALEARDHWKSGLLCGLTLALAVLLRPSNVLLIFPILVALGFRPMAWLWVGLSGLPGAVFFCYYNWRVYGSPLITGYGDVSKSFSREYLMHNVIHFAHWIPMLLTPLVFLALLSPFTKLARQRGFAALATWCVILVGFYAYYYHSGETWWYLRFILPVFPALIIAALLALELAWRRAGSRKMVAASLLALFLTASLCWEIVQVQRLDVLHLKAAEESYPDAAKWACENLAPNSALFCMQVSGAFYFYTDFLLFRYDQILPVHFNPLVNAIAQQHRPVYAALFAFEHPEALVRIGGHWTKLSTVGQVTFWQLQPE